MNRNMTHRFQQCKDRFEHRDGSAPPVAHVREPAEPVLPEGWVTIGRLHYSFDHGFYQDEVYYSGARKSWSFSRYITDDTGVSRYVILPVDNIKSAQKCIQLLEDK